MSHVTVDHLQPGGHVEHGLLHIRAQIGRFQAVHQRDRKSTRLNSSHR